MVKPPIIVNQQGDVMIFEDIKEAESYIEVVDVENEEYVVFDSEGLVLTPRVLEDGIHVRLLNSSLLDPQPVELAGVLRRMLSQLGVEKTGVREDTI